jgi:undecaprenyl-diphosphatase
MILLWLISSYYKTKESKEYALKIFYSATLGVIFCLLLNALLPFRPRPETVSAIAPLIDHLPDNSFPSMHATFTGATLSALFLFYFPFLSASLGKFWFLHSRIVRYVFVILWIIMVTSRVLAGIHYPGDILAGILLGVISTFIISKLVMKKWFYITTIHYPIKLLSHIKL